MSHAGLHKFFDGDGLKDRIRIIPNEDLPLFDQHWIRKQKLSSEYGPVTRHFIPIIDLADNQQKILSVTNAGRKALDEIIVKYIAALEHDRLLRSQAEAARRFKVSKMIYGGKR